MEKLESHKKRKAMLQECRDSDQRQQISVEEMRKNLREVRQELEIFFDNAQKYIDIKREYFMKCKAKEAQKAEAVQAAQAAHKTQAVHEAQASHEAQAAHAAQELQTVEAAQEAQKVVPETEAQVKIR